MTRTNTPDVVGVKPGPNGTVRKWRRITVKRVCTDCGETVGDLTDAELDAILNGHPLPTIEPEHECKETP